MELHFPKTSTSFQCYRLWTKSQNFSDLFTFEACTRFALGDGVYFCSGKVKTIRKGTWGWARDGWLTKTAFSSKDFMFHGWKTHKLNSEWVWPFALQKFDLERCHPKAPLVNFQYNSSFLKSDAEIMSLLQKRKEDVYNGYIEVLKKLGKLQT